MNLTIPLAALLAWPAGVALARTWSGSLVDAKCYAAELRNVNPTDTLTNVDSDGSGEIRYCAPRAKTKSFALVQYDNRTLDLDAAGNAKAADLVRSTGKRSPFPVEVIGQSAGNELRVDSISARQ
jgi:hypothetical protein